MGLLGRLLKKKADKNLTDGGLTEAVDVQDLTEATPSVGTLEVALGALATGKTGDMPIPVPSENPEDWYVEPGRWPRRLPSREKKAQMRKAGKEQRTARRRQRGAR